MGAQPVAERAGKTERNEKQQPRSVAFDVCSFGWHWPGRMPTAGSSGEYESVSSGGN